MKTKFKQLSISDVFTDIECIFEENKPKFIELFDSYIDFSEIVPQSFYDHYYSYYDLHRVFSLESMLSSLVIQKILSIPTIQLPVHILNLSKDLRELCGFFKRVPNVSQFFRFKSLFLRDLDDFFHNLVNITHPICEQISPTLSRI
ncbi:hypothetical protein BFT35_12785 [Thermoanaerobacterium thermosaccharolyticum]|jgi:hypothetical protein|uniref:transposase n=1 Tax=Thermoanaerobacterium thermosaccharolyticum TaxID=1517 RepID=UPI0001B0E410|nr:transposase [Thermoanaerobacterium thermosaccharolyticum]PHO06148.1 hypothetical protein BFT35_12785 [Thermoanaerobacterium thermosaccharolyticum]